MMLHHTCSTFMILAVIRVSVAGADIGPNLAKWVPDLASVDPARRHEARTEVQRIVAESTRSDTGEARSKAEAALIQWVSDATLPVPARVWMVKQLEYAGHDAAVSALADLLVSPEAELRDCARRALELNPSPAASVALRNALRSCTDSTLRIGLIRSLGERCDGESVAQLSDELKNGETRPAAAMALAHIGNADALASLAMAYDRSDVIIGTALIDAARGNVRVLTDLTGADNPPSIRAGALSARIRAEPARAVELIVHALSDACPRVRMAAAHAGAAVKGPRIAERVVQSWSSMSDEGRALALEFADEGARNLAEIAARGSNADLAAAAVRALERMGGAVSLAVLLDLAAGQGAVQSVAAMTLSRMTGAGVEDGLRGAAQQGESSLRAVALTALANRRQTGSMPIILTAAGGEDVAVARAALAALRSIGGDAEIAPVAGLVAKSGATDTAAALKAMASRAKDRAKAASLIVTAMNASSPAGATALMDVLSVVGGKPAVQAVARVVGSGDRVLRDGAVRALSNWMGFEAVPPLLTIASSPDSTPVHRTLAIRGVARLVASGHDASLDQRIDAALSALAAAPSASEKKMLLPAIGSIASPRSLSALEPLLGDPELSSEAAFALAALASASRKTDPAMARAIVAKLDAANAPEAARAKAKETKR